MRRFLVAAAAVFVVAMPAHAAKPSLEVTAAVTGQQVGQVTVAVTSTATRRVEVRVYCYQFAQRYLVYDVTQQVGVWDDNGDGSFTGEVTFTGVPFPVQDPWGGGTVYGGYWVPSCAADVKVGNTWVFGPGFLGI